MADPVQESRAREVREQSPRFFLHALSEIGIDKAFKRNLEYGRGVLRVGQDLLPIASYARVTVIAIGKAAHTMAQALNAEMGPQRALSLRPRSRKSCCQASPISSRTSTPECRVS